MPIGCLEWLGRLKCLATGLDARKKKKEKHFNHDTFISVVESNS